MQRDEGAIIFSFPQSVRAQSPCTPSRSGHIRVRLQLQVLHLTGLLVPAPACPILSCGPHPLRRPPPWITLRKWDATASRVLIWDCLARCHHLTSKVPRVLANTRQALASPANQSMEADGSLNYFIDMRCDCKPCTNLGLPCKAMCILTISYTNT